MTFDEDKFFKKRKTDKDSEVIIPADTIPQNMTDAERIVENVEEANTVDQGDVRL